MINGLTMALAQVPLSGFGWFFLPILIICGIFYRQALVPLILVSMVFQATAVIFVPLGETTVSTTPYMMAGLVAWLALGRRLLLQPA